jgi:hypothetical protein
LAEELAHLGLSPIVLVDPDIFEPPNLARHNLSATALGKPKATGLAEQIHISFPPCDAKGIDQDFLGLSDELQRALVADADIVIAATGNFACDQQINRLCVEARKPAIYPRIWVDRGVRDAEVGEILWVDPRRPTPCYQCASMGRREREEVRGWRGARTDIKMVVLVAAQVVEGLLQPDGDRARMLDPERTCIWVHTYMPLSEGVSDVFDDVPGIRTFNLRVPWPRRGCPACGGREDRHRPPPPPDPPDTPPDPPVPTPQRSNTQALISAAVLAVITFAIVVALVDQQRADVINHGVQGNTSPYAFFGFFVGIIGFVIVVSIINWAIDPEHQLNWPVIGGLTVVFAIILFVLISIFAKHASAPSSPYGMSARPPAASSHYLSAFGLKCDPTVGSSDWVASVGTTIKWHF